MQNIPLSAVAQGEYQRFLASQPSIRSHPLLNPLASSNILVWEEAENIFETQAISQADEHLRPYVQAVLYAKLIEGMLRTGPLVPHKCQRLVRALEYLTQTVPGFSITEEVDALISQAAQGMVNANSCQEMCQIYRVVKYVKDNFQTADLDVLVDAMKLRCFFLLADGVTDISVAGLKHQLNDMCELAELEIDCSPTLSIAVNAAVCIIPQSTLPEAERKELLELLMKLCPEDSAVIELAQELGAPPQGQPQAPPRDPFELVQRDLPAVPGYISAPSQLVISELPISANSSHDPQIFVYTAGFEYRGFHVEGVVKQFISADSEKLVRADRNECRILAYLSDKGQYFLKYYGHYTEALNDGRQCFSIVMERCNQSLMCDFTRRFRNCTPYSEAELIFLFRSLLEAFNIMGCHKIFHYDVKPHNILISDDGQLKICDFNFSNMLETSRFTTVPTGTVPIQGTDGYMAPEIQEIFDLKKAGRDPPPLHARPGRIDCYGIGLILLQAATLESITGLNRREHQDDLQRKIQQVKFAWLRNCLQEMLKFNFRERSSIKTLLKQMQGNLYTESA